MNIQSVYQKRAIRFLELVQQDNWTLKVYGISATGEFPAAQIVSAAKALAFQRLPQPAITDNCYGAAFLIVHQGADANWILLDWWVDECILQHHVYTSPLDDPQTLRYISPTGILACVWELAVHSFERQAWIDTVLANPAGPNPDAYFAAQLNDNL